MRNVKLRYSILALALAFCLVSCMRMNQPPTAVIQSPTAGTTYLEGEPIAFAGTAIDSRDGSLVGESLVWFSNLDGEIGTGSAFACDDLSMGSHTITLSATNALGLTASASVLITISDNNPPVAAISSPADGETFARNEPITFDGEATDAEDGALTGASLLWSSSLDGTIGSGSSLIKTTLSEGTHVITLTATDSEGVVSTDTVTIYVQGPLSDSCYVYSIPDSGGLIALEIPQAGQELFYTLTVSWEGPTLGASNPGFFWAVNFTQATDGSWVAGPAISIAGVTISDGRGTNGNSTSEDVIGGGMTPGGNLFALHDDYPGVETDPSWWTFELVNSDPADQFSNVKLYVFPEAAIKPQELEQLIMMQDIADSYEVTY